MEQINVLVVDDSLVIRGMIVNILEKDSGITVVGAAASAADADAVLRSKIVDVVTLDIEMPGISGMDYLPSLARRHIPTVMLSGRTAEGSDERGAALRQGASACFNKANAVRDAAALIQQVKDAARKKVRLSAEDAAGLSGKDANALAAPPAPAPPADPQPAPDAGTESPADPTHDALAMAKRLVDQHGPEAMRVLAERVGQLALRGEVKRIETWRAIAAHIETLTHPAGHA